MEFPSPALAIGEWTTGDHFEARDRERIDPGSSAALPRYRISFSVRGSLRASASMGRVDLERNENHLNIVFPRPTTFQLPPSSGIEGEVRTCRSRHRSFSALYDTRSSAQLRYVSLNARFYERSSMSTVVESKSSLSLSLS